MTSLALWFILTGGSGYLPPLNLLPADIHCGVTGAVAPGLQINARENPSLALWRDPADATKHCEVNIAAKVNTLAMGEYHLATTVMGTGNWVGPDPHTSVMFMRGTGTVVEPPVVEPPVVEPPVVEPPVVEPPPVVVPPVVPDALAALTALIVEVQAQVQAVKAAVEALTPAPDTSELERLTAERDAAVARVAAIKALIEAALKTAPTNTAKRVTDPLKQALTK